MVEDYDVDEDKTAKFNAGVLQTKRIDNLLTTINFCKNNPSSINGDYMEYNYIIWFNNVNSLFDEVDGWCNDDEEDDIVKDGTKIDKLIDEHPVWEDKKPTRPEKKEKELNKIKLKIIVNTLRNYERKVRKLGIKYQVIAATADSEFDGL